MEHAVAFNGSSLSGHASHPAIHLMTSHSAASDASRNQRSLVIIDTRALDRECLAQSMMSRGTSMKVVPVGSVEEWGHAKKNHPPLGAILFNIGSRKVSDTSTEAEIRKLVAEFAPAPVVLLSDDDDLAQVLKALEIGARGYIPSSVGVGVCIEAIGLAQAGGMFVPASSVLARRQSLQSSTENARPLEGMFTARQAEVVEALRRGKANKIIAYELNLRESTVKVHIRNIMKKLKATNRTEVAYKINDLFPIH
jgi:DNA-binding NarL/FixJ family response regulator